MFGLFRPKPKTSEVDAIIERYGDVLATPAMGTRSVSVLQDPKSEIKKALLVAMATETDKKRGDALAAGLIHLAGFQEMTDVEAEKIRGFHMLSAMASQASEATLAEMATALADFGEVATRYGEMEAAEMMLLKAEIKPHQERLGF